MATAREHMAADLAFVLADTGEGAEEVSFDFGSGAVPVACFTDRIDLEAADYEGGVVEHVQVTMLPGVLPVPMIDQEIKVNGKRAVVVSVDATDLYVDFTYERRAA